MAYEKIDLETPQPNGKVGEPGPTAWAKARRMFIELYGGRTDQANRLHYMDANAKDAFTPITQAARDLLDDADVAAMLQTLGLGAPSTIGKNVLKAADSAAIRSLIGLVIASSGSWADRTPYIASNGITDICTALDFHASGTDTDDYTNRLIGSQTSGLLLQRKGDSAGRLMFDQSNILGELGFVSGVPSGAIIKYIAGSDGQSHVIRLADGTQIAWGTSTDLLNANGAYGPGYISTPAYTAYPAAFSGVPRVMYTTQNHANAPSFIITDTTPTSTSCSTRIFGFVQNAQARYGYLAIGRWN